MYQVEKYKKLRNVLFEIIVGNYCWELLLGNIVGSYFGELLHKCWVNHIQIYTSQDQRLK